MSDTEIRTMRFTIEQLSAELQAKRQYVSDIETKLDRTRKALDIAVEEITKIKVAAESVGIGFFMTAAIFALAKINEIKGG